MFIYTVDKYCQIWQSGAIPNLNVGASFFVICFFSSFSSETSQMCVELFKYLHSHLFQQFCEASNNIFVKKILPQLLKFKAHLNVTKELGILDTFVGI